MVAPIRIYFEGDARLKEGFGEFFRDLALERRPKFIAGKGREQVMADFQTALKTHKNDHLFLLIDSEGPYRADLFAKVCKTLPPATKSRVFWMVQAMETWFLADIEALRKHYPQGLREKRLKNPARAENAPGPKELIKAATRDCGGYEVADAVELLKAIRPEMVQEACPHCREVFVSFPEQVKRGLPKS